MKYALSVLCLAGLVSACSSSPSQPAQPSLSPLQVKVDAYLRKTLDDPASYQSVSWGKPSAFEQREIDAENAEAEGLVLDQQIALAKIQTESMARLNDIEGVSDAVFNRPKKALRVYLHRADSVKEVQARLAASTDTTQLGQSIRHTFRAKNKMGALVLDSARFIVLKSGAITATK